MFNILMVPVIFLLGILIAHFFYKKELFQEQLKRVQLEQRVIQLELCLEQYQKKEDKK